MHVTGIYAALGALLLLVLAVRISLARRAARVGIGDGGNHELVKRIRAHANAAEYLPIALLLLLLLDLGQTPPLWLHVFGVALIVGRVLHAIGLSRTAGESFGRLVGIALTWGVMLAMAVLLLWKAAMY
jgi:uncharacterized membrane protein YecN with MAPEG domain